MGRRQNRRHEEMRRIIFSLALILVLPIASYAAGIFHPDKSGDEVLQSLINDKASKFTLHTYSDDVSGLAIKYSVYLPENYSAEKKYPAVFFIADGSSAGKAPQFSLTQGYGALVWPDDCIVIVPAYPVTILDDHNGFVITEYIWLTQRFVNWALTNYSIDASRVYATGQSMGCMTWLVLASQYPDLFTACLFVSGQWNIDNLQGLKSQKFIYITSLGDDKASKGQREVIDMFMHDGNAFMLVEEIDARNQDYVLPKTQASCYFLTFKAGSTLPDETEGRYSEHMTSFDYAYKMQSVREWLLAQKKGE